MVQRMMDLVLAGMVALLLAPLMLGIALWIRLDSPGPVLFRQVRVGRHGRPFRIHKFRTMVHRADTGNPSGADQTAITTASDPRITRAGRVLRRHKLDELPQLWDVLVGSMSLVGPRPEVPRYVALYPPGLRQHLLAVRPGLTDPASLAFADENERLARAVDSEREYVEVVLPAKLELSAAYLRRRSAWGDLRLLAQTVSRLITGAGERAGRP